MIFKRKGVIILVKTTEINLFYLLIRNEPNFAKQELSLGSIGLGLSDWTNSNATDRNATDHGFAMCT